MKLRRRQPVATLIILPGCAFLSSLAQAADTLLYVHSNSAVCTTGPNPSATTFYLDSFSPTAFSVKCRDSAALNRNHLPADRNLVRRPDQPGSTVRFINDLHGWIGPRNSDDVGTYFNLQAQQGRDESIVEERLGVLDPSDTGYNSEHMGQKQVGRMIKSGGDSRAKAHKAGGSAAGLRVWKTAEKGPSLQSTSWPRHRGKNEFLGSSGILRNSTITVGL